MDRVTDLRTLERESIRAFVQGAADEGYLSGRVLDYGCGKQPYRDIVEAAGGEYHGYDRVDLPANVSGEDIGFVGVANWMWNFNAILCTQVVQYVPLYPYYSGLEHVLSELNLSLENDDPGVSGHLVLTYPTNWPEVEPEDLHRFTKAGMERLLTEAGFTIVRHERRATAIMAVSDYESRNERVALGYGVIARA